MALADFPSQPPIRRRASCWALTAMFLAALALSSCGPEFPLPTGETQPTFSASRKVAETPTLPPSTSVPDLPITRPLRPDGDPSRPFLLFNSANHVNRLVFDGRWKWAVGLDGGLTRSDPQTLQSVRHTRATCFPLDQVFDLASDPEGKYLYAVGSATSANSGPASNCDWSEGGLAVWDGVRWRLFSPEDLGFTTGSTLSAVAVETGTTLWVGARPEYLYEKDTEALPRSVRVAGVQGGGLRHGDWTSPDGGWESAPAGAHITDLAFDRAGNLWIASAPTGDAEWRRRYDTKGGLSRPPADWREQEKPDLGDPTDGPPGLMRYDGERWTRYAFDGAHLLDQVVYPAAVDAGAATWTEYGTDGVVVRDATIDSAGNTWIATDVGLQFAPPKALPRKRKVHAQEHPQAGWQKDCLRASPIPTARLWLSEMLLPFPPRSASISPKERD